jgi:hypothetical protein
LKLLDNKLSTAGVTIGSYRRDGAVKTGNFATNAPSELERARRERMRREG